MGTANAIGMADAVHEGGISLGVALEWHLRSNHFPPVPRAMIPVAEAAIEAGNDDDYDRLIDLPEGTTYRDGRTSVEAYAIIESFHLGAFIENESEDW